MGRIWTYLADTYLPMDLRDRFLTLAQQSRWVPADGRHPFSTGQMLSEAIPQLRRDTGLRNITHVTYGQSWVIREDNYRLEPYAFDFMIHGQILGVRSETDRWSFYLLDVSTGAAPIVHIFDEEDQGGPQ